MTFESQPTARYCAVPFPNDSLAQVFAGIRLAPGSRPVTSSIERSSPAFHPSPASGEPPWHVYAEGVRLIALRRLGDASLADDVAQEAITRAISSLVDGRSEPISDLGAFVYGIARHLIADLHRGGGRTVPLESVAEPLEPRASALDTAIAAEERQQVNDALQRLDAADRDLLTQFFIEGRDADDIARRLGSTAVNIRKRKSRLLQRLRRLVKGGHESDPSPTGE